MLTSDTGTWEHMIDFLQNKAQLKMDAPALDGTDVAEIIVSIVMAWRKKENVTVRKFCDLCNELHVYAVQELMEKAEDNARNSTSHDV